MKWSQGGLWREIDEIQALLTDSMYIESVSTEEIIETIS